MQVDIERDRWIDPAGADVALATWAEEFLSLARRLSPSTQESLPKLVELRTGRVLADSLLPLGHSSLRRVMAG